MAIFIEIAQKKMQSQASGGQSMPMKEDPEQLKKEIARLEEIIRYQELKIAELNNLLTKRDSALNTRERACNEKAKLIAEAVNKLKSVKATAEEELRRAKDELRQAELCHQEDLKRVQAAEQYGKEMAEALKKMNQKLESLETSLKQAHYQIERLQTQQGYFPSSMPGENVDVPLRVKKSEIEEESKRGGITSKEKETAVIESEGKDPTPLGYTPPVSNGRYHRGMATLLWPDTRLQALESKFDILTKTVSELKRQTPGANPLRKEAVVEPGSANRVFEELHNFILDFP